MLSFQNSNSNSITGRVAFTALNAVPNYHVGKFGSFVSDIDKAGVENRPAGDPGVNSPGSLYIQDTFTPSFNPGSYSAPEAAHGVKVAMSARQMGFRGRIVGQEAAYAPYDPNKPSDLAYQSSLYTTANNPKEARQKLREYAVGAAGRLLDQSTNYLQDLTSKGVSDSAVNFSSGRNVANTASDLYQRLAPALSRNPNLASDKLSQAMLDNVTLAFDLDRKKLASSDPKVRDKEMGRLLQGLIDQSEAGYDSPALKAQRKRYDKAVSAFEAGHNSVVVSAGNQGDYLQQLQQICPLSRPLAVSSNFTQNVLENNDVTLVGATELSADRFSEQRARYSSPSREVDVYAPGWLNEASLRTAPNESGTSYAAPRVAAMMAELHRRNPGMSSSRIEKLLMTQLSHTVEGQGGSMPTLDAAETRKFLADRTF